MTTTPLQVMTHNFAYPAFVTIASIEGNNLNMGKRERSSESDKKTKKRAKQETITEETRDSVAHENENLERLPQKNDATKPRTKSSRKKAVFLKKKIDVELSLLPSSLHNTEEAVHNSLNQLLLKYSDGLGGILMGCENVRIMTEGDGKGRGWILNELPWIHYTVSCDALVFRPYIGGELHGVVNECFPSHLGMLVLNYFNAMVSAEQLRGAGYSFDADLQKWVSESAGQTISVNSKITFDVEKIHECDGTMSLEGVKPSLSLLVEA